MKKRIAAILMCMVMTMGLFAGCTSTDSTDTASTSTGTTSTEVSTGGSNETKSDLKYAVVLHALNSSFYAKIQEGAQEAGKALGITVDVMAPNTANNLAEQVSMIETCISSGYDGIATVVWDPDGFSDVLKKLRMQEFLF